MLFNYPSFIGEKEQNESERLMNNVKILLQTHIDEIWLDVTFGTNIRNYLKQGINNITLFEIKDEIQAKLLKYFGNELEIASLTAKQDNENLDKIIVSLTYIELRTGIHYTVQTEETIINTDTSLY